MANNPLDFDKLVKSYGESFPMVQIIDKEGKVVNEDLIPDLSDEDRKSVV